MFSVSPQCAPWRVAVLVLHSWTLLRVSAEARPFVLISGWDSLPDDDLTPVHEAGAIVSGALKVPLQQLPMSSLPGAVHRHVAKETGSLAGATMGAAVISGVQPVKCRDARQDVMIESGLQGHDNVFSAGRTDSSWLPGSNFVLPSLEKVVVFAVRTGQGALLAQPNVAVSDASILSVALAESTVKGGKTAGKDAEPVVFLSNHFCKKAGIATVTVTLPLQKDNAVASSTALCAGSLAPIVFSYQKACAPPVPHSMKTFVKGLTAEIPKTDKLHALHTELPVHNDRPWKGIVPFGGARVVLLVVLILVLGVIIFEFSSYWMAQKMKMFIIDLGPRMFGCEITMQSVNLGWSWGRLTYTMKGLRLGNPEGDYTTEFFMQIDEAKVKWNMTKMLCTWGREIEMRQMTAKHIHMNIEVDGYLYGVPNIKKVMAQMEKNNKEWVQSLADIKSAHGIDAAWHWDQIAQAGRRVADRVTLKEASSQGIDYTFQSKAIGCEVAIPDMHFDNFSEQYNAVGMRSVMHHLTNCVLQGVASDIAGVDFGHGGIEVLVNSVKRWTGAEENASA